MEPFKNVYSPAFYEKLGNRFQHLHPSFDKQRFEELIFDAAFESRELKDRMRHTTGVLHQLLPSDFPTTSQLLLRYISEFQEELHQENAFPYLIFPDYVGTYGLEHFEEAMQAIEKITPFITCEYAVRPFFLQYEAPMLAQMKRWALHTNHHVRRLASEGSRPRLPWGMALGAFKKDPMPILPILYTLKNDPSEYVRKSVANSLNDISKDHPQVVLDILKEWSGSSKETDWVVRHASRTLLKQGHTEVLRHFELHGADFITFSDFDVLTPHVTIGDPLIFQFSIEHASDKPQKIRLEYGIYYRLANGQSSKKVFKISEKLYPPHQKATIVRNQSFKPITTKVFYPGIHQVAIILNGVEQAPLAFELLGKKG